MKRLCLSLLLMTGVLSAADIGLMPKDKTTIVLEGQERNPFGKPATKEPEKIDEAKGEEVSIREAIGALKIRGVMGSAGNRKVLLGSFPLSVGRKLPAVIPNQTEVLYVKEITDKQIDLVFEKGPGRLITIFIEVDPAVREMIEPRTPSSAHGDKDGKAAKLGRVLKSENASTAAQ